MACVASFLSKLIARRGLTPNELTDPVRFDLQIEWAVVLSLLVLSIVLFLEHRPLSSME
jgi:hypothetical protein